MSPRRPRLRSSRRGSGIAAIVMLVALLNIVVVGVLAASADDADVDALRLDTTRALYAAESGARIVSKLARKGLAPPTVSSTFTLPSADVQFVSVPALGASGDATLLGRSGLANRRVKVTLALP